MIFMEDKYIPVTADFFDALEEMAAMRQMSDITFMQNGGKAVVHGKITGLHEGDGAPYLQLDGGLHIRLDKIVEVNGRPANAYC